MLPTDEISGDPRCLSSRCSGPRGRGRRRLVCESAMAFSTTDGSLIVGDRQAHGFRLSTVRSGVPLGSALRLPTIPSRFEPLDRAEAVAPAPADVEYPPSRQCWSVRGLPDELATLARELDLTHDRTIQCRWSP
jgi:hypothetical protein